jgi:hypothetical protein
MMQHLNLQSSSSNISSPTFVFFRKVKVKLSICLEVKRCRCDDDDASSQLAILSIQHLITHFCFFSGKSKFSVADVMTMMHHLNLQSSASNISSPTSVFFPESQSSALQM